MNKNLLAFSLTLVFSGITPISQAENTEAVGNSTAGKEKASSCIGCHGENGNSMVSTFPKLAQQHASYLQKQLQEFKDGNRKDAVMAPMAVALSEQDMLDIGAYFAEQKISENPDPSLPPAADDEAAVDENKAKEEMQTLLKKGSNLYRNGNLENKVSACIACHGASGEGNKPAAFPALHGQHADYLIKSLTDFKAGLRSNNPDNMMRMIAHKMTNEEIKAVGYYVSTLK